MNYIEGECLNKQESIKNKSNVTCQLSLFFLINILILSCIGYCLLNKNIQNMLILNFPADSEGKICNRDFPQNFPYLYIDFNGSQITYKCVNQCPNEFNDYMIIDSSSHAIFSAYAQHPDQRLGNICWSQNKNNAINSLGLDSQLNYKQALLDKFSAMITLMIISFSIGFIYFLCFYWMPLRLNYYLAIISAFALLLLFTKIILTRQIVENRLIYQIAIALTLIFLITSVIFGIRKLELSIGFTQPITQQIKEGQESSAIKIVKFVINILIFSIANGLLLIFILAQYLCFISSDPIIKQQSQIYYTVQKTSWKYIVLGFQWLFLSNLIFNIYQLIVVKNAYLVANNKKLYCAKIKWTNVLNLYEFAFIQSLFWIPLHAILLIKPQGDKIRENQQQSCCGKVTQAYYCCCGVFINWLHKYTFNPFLILVIQSDFDNLRSSLAVVQEIYHREDPEYDKSSLWLYRFCSYISIAILSIVLLRLLSESQYNLVEQQSVSLFFDIVSVTVSVEVVKYWLCFWSSLTQVSQFMQICKCNNLN